MNIMESQKQKNLYPSTDVKFFVVGSRRLENEMIASCLKNNTGRESFLFEDIKRMPGGAQKDRGEKRLVFYCCHGKDVNQVLAEIKNYTKNKDPENRIVLFNVSKGVALEKVILSKKVQGVFYEHDTLDIFLKGVKSVLDGKLWFSRDIMTKFIFEGIDKDKSLKKSSNRLTERQIEILALVAVGATNEEIADKLYISPNTVKTHLYNIFRKINVPNRVQASLWAAKNL
jgi:DNA-binding NarL/FixJ family response regulator